MIVLMSFLFKIFILFIFISDLSLLNVAANEPGPNSRTENHTKEFLINFKNIKLPYWMEVPKMDPCPLGTKMLILIMSRREALPIRNAIRQTWAKDAPPGYIYRFLIADPKIGSDTSAEEENRRLKDEQFANGDLILQKGFEDKYENLHLKWYAGLEWQQTFCAAVEWILKSDDDTVVHLARLDYWIEHKFRAELAKNPATFFGSLYIGMRPTRDNISKWYVPESSFPDPVYPDYLQGSTYLASRQAISAIMPFTGQVIGFNIDDVLFTGILADLANVTRSSQPGHFALILAQNWKNCDENGILKSIAVTEEKSPEAIKLAYEVLSQATCEGINPLINTQSPWIQVKDHCFKLIKKERISQPEAINACNDWHANLASIRDEQDLDALLGLIQNETGGSNGFSRFWTGLQMHRRSDNGSLVSVSFVSGVSTSFVDPSQYRENNRRSPWAIGSVDGNREPDNRRRNEFCVTLADRGNGQLFAEEGLVDEPCTGDLVSIGGFLCEKEAINCLK